MAAIAQIKFLVADNSHPATEKRKPRVLLITA